VSCRICGASRTREVARYAPYLDYACRVLDCDACGCRFVLYDASVYERLHASPTSSYRAHEELAARCAERLEAGDLPGLRRLLSRSAKFRFVLDALADRPELSRLLEVGCSRGSLSSWFLGAGREILGVDLSPHAVAAAAARFGDHFAAADSPRVEAGAPYDAIFHVGTIGCVEHPIELTERLLSLLRPGGVLLFNAPDAQRCRRLGEPWVAGTAPPDLVTLFDADFWPRQFAAAADVSVRFAAVDDVTRLALAARELLGLRQLRQGRRRLLESGRSGAGRGGFPGRRLGALGRRGLARLLRVGRVRTALISRVPEYRAEFGMLVTIRRKDG